MKSLLEEGFFDDDENTTKGRETHVFYGTGIKHTAFAEELKNTLGGRVNIIHAYSARRSECAEDWLKRLVNSGS